MRKLKSAAVAALLTVAATGAAVSAPLGGTQTAASTSAQREMGRYTALGDSYASGVGAGRNDPSSGACLRSENNYPNQWAFRHSDWVLRDVTCSGATIADVREKQLSAVTEETNLVTVTVGGNDAQFASVARACLTEDDAYCKTATQWMSHYAKNQMVEELSALYTDIKARAPRALVLVFGYPRVIAESGSCAAPIDLSADKRANMNALADALAEGTMAATTKAGVYFIDMREHFNGHEACSNDPWIHGVDPTDPTVTFHPNLAGHAKGYGEKFSATWG